MCTPQLTFTAVTAAALLCLSEGREETRVYVAVPETVFQVSREDKEPLGDRCDRQKGLAWRNHYQIGALFTALFVDMYVDRRVQRRFEGSDVGLPNR